MLEIHFFTFFFPRDPSLARITTRSPSLASLFHRCIPEHLSRVSLPRPNASLSQRPSSAGKSQRSMPSSARCLGKAPEAPWPSAAGGRESRKASRPPWPSWPLSMEEATGPPLLCSRGSTSSGGALAGAAAHSRKRRCNRRSSGTRTQINE